MEVGEFKTVIGICIALLKWLCLHLSGPITSQTSATIAMLIDSLYKRVCEGVPVHVHVSDSDRFWAYLSEVHGNTVLVSSELNMITPMCKDRMTDKHAKNSDKV